MKINEVKIGRCVSSAIFYVVIIGFKNIDDNLNEELDFYRYHYDELRVYYYEIPITTSLHDLMEMNIDTKCIQTWYLKHLTVENKCYPEENIKTWLIKNEMINTDFKEFMQTCVVSPEQMVKKNKEYADYLDSIRMKYERFVPKKIERLKAGNLYLDIKKSDEFVVLYMYGGKNLFFRFSFKADDGINAYDFVFNDTHFLRQRLLPASNALTDYIKENGRETGINVFDLKYNRKRFENV